MAQFGVFCVCMCVHIDNLGVQLNFRAQGSFGAISRAKFLTALILVPCESHAQVSLGWCCFFLPLESDSFSPLCADLPRHHAPAPRVLILCNLGMRSVFHLGLSAIFQFSLKAQLLCWPPCFPESFHLSKPIPPLPLMSPEFPSSFHYRYLWAWHEIPAIFCRVSNGPCTHLSSLTTNFVVLML